MEISFSKIKKLIEFRNGKSGSYTRTGIRPKQDWKVLVITTAIILCFIGLGSYYFYYRIDQGKLFTISEDQSQSSLTIDTKLLKKIINNMNERQTFIPSLLDPKSPSIVDPAL